MIPYTTNGKQLTFDKPIVMGIVNLTPDSFYDGGSYLTPNDVLADVAKKVAEGAGIIDLGAFSSRPGALEISEKEELERLLPVLKLVRKEFAHIFLSIDTYRANVVKAVVNEGADIINDISGGNMDAQMVETIAKLDIPYILMHMQGNPQTMQQAPAYVNVTEDVVSFFDQKLKVFETFNFNKVILDPGFGFGKELDHNYELLKNLSIIKKLEFPVLVGISRKSMINKVLKTLPKEALNGTTVLNTIALLNGANILRVHDVKEAIQTIKLVDAYNKTN